MGILVPGVPAMLDMPGMPGMLIGADLQAARRVAAQGDFRTVHLEDARIAAGGAVSRRDAGAGDESKLHQAARVFGRQIDPLEDGGIAFSQVQEASVRRFR